jgi:GNAT superfamily N-acetyltransferase
MMSVKLMQSDQGYNQDKSIEIMKICDIHECVDANKTVLVMESLFGIRFTIRQPRLSDAGAINRISIDRRPDIVRSAGWAAIHRQVKRHQEVGVEKYEGLVRACIDYPLRNFGRVALCDETLVGFVFAGVKPDGREIEFNGRAVDKDYEGYGLASALGYLRLKWTRLVGLPVSILVDPQNEEMQRMLRDEKFQPNGTRGPSADLPLQFDVLELSQEGVAAAIAMHERRDSLFSFSPEEDSGQT